MIKDFMKWACVLACALFVSAAFASCEQEEVEETPEVEVSEEQSEDESEEASEDSSEDVQASVLIYAQELSCAAQANNDLFVCVGVSGSEEVPSVISDSENVVVGEAVEDSSDSPFSEEYSVYYFDLAIAANESGEAVVYNLSVYLGEALVGSVVINQAAEEDNTPSAQEDLDSEFLQESDGLYISAAVIAENIAGDYKDMGALAGYCYYLYWNESDAAYWVIPSADGQISYAEGVISLAAGSFAIGGQCLSQDNSDLYFKKIIFLGSESYSASALSADSGSISAGEKQVYIDEDSEDETFYALSWSGESKDEVSFSCSEAFSFSDIIVVVEIVERQSIVDDEEESNDPQGDDEEEGDGQIVDSNDVDADKVVEDTEDYSSYSDFIIEADALKSVLNETYGYKFGYAYASKGEVNTLVIDQEHVLGSADDCNVSLYAVSGTVQCTSYGDVYVTSGSVIKIAVPEGKSIKKIVFGTSWRSFESSSALSPDSGEMYLGSVDTDETETWSGTGSSSFYSSYYWKIGEESSNEVSFTSNSAFYFDSLEVIFK